MKLCSLLLCCVLIVQNGVIGEEDNEIPELEEQTFQPGISTNPNQNQPNQPLDFTPAKFSAHLYEVVEGSQPGNFVLSPLSLRNALVLVSLGAAGDTGKEILRVLQFPEDTNVLIYNQSQLMRSLKGLSSGDSGVEFVAADRIYINKNLRVKNQYKKDVKEAGGEIDQVNFSDNEGAAAQINGWVKTKTAGKIEKIVDASGLSDQTSLLVLNTIYFKGQWKSQFPVSNTGKRPFSIEGNNNKVMVDTMLQESEFQFADLEDADAKIINLPYKGERLSMMVYLPNQWSSLGRLESWLKNKSPFEIQEEHLSQSELPTVTVSLPKFKIRSSLELNEPLKTLGLRQMFDEGAANFSKIFADDNDSFVSKVFQETFIEVNEEGTEAAAATGAEYGATSLPPSFTADRPFLFQILDSESKTVLYTGRVKDPRAEFVDSLIFSEQTEDATAGYLDQDASVESNTKTSVNAGSGEKSSVETADDNRNRNMEKVLLKFMENMNETMEDLKSRMTRLENVVASKTGAESESVSEVTTTTEAPKENSAVVSTSGAWGYATTDFFSNQVIRWEYDSAFHSTCANLAVSVYSVHLKGPCVALYRYPNCSGDRFQLDTSNYHLGQEIRRQFQMHFFEFYASPMSIGTCF